MPFACIGAVIAEEERIAQLADIRFACEEIEFRTVLRFSECVAVQGGERAAVLHAERASEQVVEQGFITRDYRISSRQVRFIYKFSSAAPDQGEAVPQEILFSLAVNGGGNLSIDMVIESRDLFPLHRNCQNLVQPAILIHLVALFYKPAGRIVFIFGHGPFCIGARNQLIRIIIDISCLGAVYRFFKNIAGRVVHVFLQRPVLLIQYRKQLSAGIVTIALFSAVYLATGDRAVDGVKIPQNRNRTQFPSEIFGCEAAVLSLFDEAVIHFPPPFHCRNNLLNLFRVNLNIIMGNIGGKVKGH